MPEQTFSREIKDVIGVGHRCPQRFQEADRMQKIKEAKPDAKPHTGQQKQGGSEDAAQHGQQIFHAEIPPFPWYISCICISGAK